MKFSNLFQAALLVASFTSVTAHPQRKTPKNPQKAHLKPERVRNNPQKTAGAKAPPVLPTIAAKVGAITVPANTTTGDVAAAKAVAAAVAGTSVKGTILVIARDTVSAYSAWSGLNGYAIPYQVLVVPKTGAALPTLYAGTAGNFGAIVVLSEVSYDYGGTLGYQSALTTAQWTQLYEYQVDFGVRMVRLDVFPGPDFGATALGGCCSTGVEQLVSISDNSQFPTAGLKTGANVGVTTAGLWHYPSSITNTSIATPFATFGTAPGFPTSSVAGVINTIGGRKQMVFFISWAIEWSQTSNFLQHAWIHWATRGLYTGYRRINLGTQVDDMFLESSIYEPPGTTYKLTTADLDAHKTWQANLNTRLPSGSSYFLEIAHNGNGNIINAEAATSGTQCGIGPIDYAEQFDTPLEWKKPLGTGTNLWPATPANYPYTTSCLNLDPLKAWFTNNLNTFAHLSHTFTHEDLNNATYFDTNREILWNQKWLTQSGIAGANKFSAKGLVPPAITGLHNGDALKAWKDNGITNVVGDNTRPPLLNAQNEHWPLVTNVADNGYAGITIIPRWATTIYYNCDSPACTVKEWIDTSAGAGDWYTLLDLERRTNTRHLFGLRRDPYMFHQANMNYVTAGQTTINGVSSKLSLIQAWVEVITQEMSRLTSWPIITIKHDDIATAFTTRAVRDKCLPKITWATNPTARTITGVTVSATGNTCGTRIPVTFPGTVTNNQGATVEQVGSDPRTLWVQLSGSPVTFTLSTAIPY